jgi:putative hydrolase of the HAD superfamily
MENKKRSGCILFDWGDTLMRVFPEFDAPMYTWPQVQAVDHAGDVLAGLRSQWMLALATNASASEEKDIWAALERVGLKKLLDKVYCYKMIGHKKPSREFFDYILRDLSVDRSQVVMVGDDFEADVIGANQSHIKGVWFNERTRENKQSPLYRTIHDLQNLPAALDSLNEK